MKKIDPTLRTLLRQDLAKRGVQRAPGPTPLDPRLARVRAPAAPGAAEPPPGEEPPQRVSVLVRFTGDVEDLRAVGFEPTVVKTHPIQHFKIASGTVPLDRLEELAAIGHVQEIEGPRTFRPELDHSVPEIRASTVHNAATSYKGRGVVIGIIDDGIDYRHEVFRKADGTSRILALWDQFLTPAAGESAPYMFPPGPAGPVTNRGVEYSKAQIDAALAAANPFATVRSRASNQGHGTHVAGIAGGDGSKAGNCSGAFTYVGVAPEADLIFVKVNTSDDPAMGNSNRLLEAFEFIFEHPAAADRPVVINLSMGDDLGGHDGRTLVELGLDIFVLEESGRAIVKSAGNAANDKRHVRTTVPRNGGTADVALDVQARDGSRRYIDVWYAGGQRLDVSVEAPGAGTPTSAVVAPGDADPAWVANPAAAAGQQTTVHIDSDTAANTTGDNRVLIQLHPAGGNIPAGRWTLHFTNPGAADVALDAWIDRGDRAPQFRNPTTDRTITIPGTAEQVITVGAYAAEGPTDGDIGDFSSRGPTRDGRRKPEITAPGVAITSASSNVYEKSDCDCCCDCCLDFYTNKDGTSMAAPHVTGVIALMFEKDPDLDIAAIRTHLTASARAPGGGVALPNDTWGHGKVDANAAVVRVPAPAGGGGGGGGGVRDALMEPEPPAFTGISPPRFARPAQLRRVPAAVARLRERALATTDGEICAALVSRHFSEVRGLINANRVVATSWHRSHGPLLLRHLLERMRFPHKAWPPELEGEIYRARVRRFLGVLHRHGSPALRRDIERHGAFVLERIERPLALALGALPELRG